MGRKRLASPNPLPKYHKDNSIRMLVLVETEEERDMLLQKTTPEKRREILLAAIASEQ